MFQSFEATTKPETAKPRIAALRNEMKAKGVDAFLVPRADRFQGEYVAPCDDRLAYITSFSGSAGHAAILADRAAFFTDGRYTLQTATQVDNDIFEYLTIPNDTLANWLNQALPDAAKIAYDPWLHTQGEIEKLSAALVDHLTLCPTDNLLDATWHDRPASPNAPAFVHPIEYAGQTSDDKRQKVADEIAKHNANACVLTLPDSICWLLNIRGSDIPRVPVVQCFALIHKTGKVDLFLDPSKVETLGPDPNISVHPWDQFEKTLTATQGPILVDNNTAPIAIRTLLTRAKTQIINAPDPCILLKACKNKTELTGAASAHLRDGAAVCNFLHFVSTISAETQITEIDLVQKLEGYRAETDQLKDISFDTICGTGPNGAIVHYRVTTDSNRTVKIGDVLLVDSGGQYQDGTTDITRTLTIGPANPITKQAFTRVLQGMIAISCLRFPQGLAGRDIDAIARHSLWQAGMDFDHGTGHGVGSFLSVHEGPQGISRRSTTPFKEGMIVSNEPGYYKQGAFGIRIENLIYVKNASELAGGDPRPMFEFETLTYVPIDKNMIDRDLLSTSEIEWLNAYHAKTQDVLMGHVNEETRPWLRQACAPL